MQQDETSQQNTPSEVLENEETLEGYQESEVTLEDKEVVENIIESQSDEVIKLKDLLARQQADYDNFKKRVERDRGDMMYFLKADVLNKILPRVDDIERMLSSTPHDQRGTPLYTALESIYTQFIKDLEKMGCVVFISKGEAVNPEKHEVMTQAPGQEGVIIDEFLKGYMLGERVLRHAKVVVGNGL